MDILRDFTEVQLEKLWVLRNPRKATISVQTILIRMEQLSPKSSQNNPLQLAQNNSPLKSVFFYSISVIQYRPKDDR